VSEEIIETIREALLKIAESYEDKAFFAKKLAHKLEQVSAGTLNEFMKELNALLEKEIAFDEKWIGKFAGKE